MKKNLLLLVAICTVFLCNAQTNIIEKFEALNLVITNKAALNLSEKEIENSIVISAYNNKMAGTTMVYLQQTDKGLPIYNQIKSIAFKNGKVVSNAGDFLSDVFTKIDQKTALPVVSAADAVKAAIENRGLKTTENPVSLKMLDNGRKIEFGKLGVAHENITAELMWFPVEKSKLELKLGWQVYIVQKTSSDYWLVNVSAIDKSLISLGNLTVYCNWDDPNHNKNHFKEKNNTNSTVKMIKDFPWSNLLSVSQKNGCNQIDMRLWSFG